MQRIPIYICPSEVNDRPGEAPDPVRYPCSYAANVGSWFVYDPNTGQGGDGAFPMNRRRGNAADFGDGLSNTVGFAEVKAYGDYLLGTARRPATPPPNSPAEVLA